MGIEFRR